MSSDEDDGYVVRVRGLPWSATKEEIINFFSDCAIKRGPDGIHMTFSREGRPSGEAYVEMEGEEDVKKGLDKHNSHMGHRYIEVFRSKRSEMEWVVKRSGIHQQDSLTDGCVRLRGLPYGCSKEEIAQFFSGLEIVPNGITLPTDYQGRSTGEAYVQFASRDIAEKAMGKHKEKIGHRYIEIFKSSLQEIRSAVGMGPPKMRPFSSSSRRSPYDRNDRFGGPGGRFGMGRGSRNFRGFMDDEGYGDYGGGGNFSDMGSNYSRGGGDFGSRMSRSGGFGDMRGGRFGGMGGGMGGRGGDGYGGNYGGGRGPDYDDFGRGGGGGGGNGGGDDGHRVHMRGLPFRAIEQDIYEFFHPLKPLHVTLLYDDNDRPSGEADVEFCTHEEAVKAMSKDKAHMQHRYIELFLNSTPSPTRRNSGGGYGSGMSRYSPGGGSGGMGFGGGMNSPMGGGGGGRFGGGGDSMGNNEGFFGRGGMDGGYCDDVRGGYCDNMGSNYRGNMGGGYCDDVGGGGYHGDMGGGYGGDMGNGYHGDDMMRGDVRGDNMIRGDMRGDGVMRGGMRDDMMRGDMRGGDDMRGNMRGDDMMRGGMRGDDMMRGGMRGDDMRGGMRGDDMRGGMRGDDMRGGMRGDDMRGGMRGDDMRGGMRGDDMRGGMRGDDMRGGIRGDDVRGGMRGDDMRGGMRGDDMRGGMRGDGMMRGGGMMRDDMRGDREGTRGSSMRGGGMRDMMRGDGMRGDMGGGYHGSRMGEGMGSMIGGSNYTAF